MTDKLAAGASTDEALAHRAVACAGWRWMPGMLTSLGRVDDDLEVGGIGLPALECGERVPLPDLADPATLGCLAELLRKAYPTHVWWECGPPQEDPPLRVWNWIDGYDLRCIASGHSIQEVLVKALEGRGVIGRKEDIADLAHRVWSEWWIYHRSRCHVVPVEGEDVLIIPAEYVARWDRQADTSYPDLSDAEKKSGRAIAKRYLKLMVVQNV